MARTVQLACARCGHTEMYVVESTKNAEAVTAVVRGHDGAADDSSTSAEARLRRLELLPTSLPVGGIITPV